MKKKGTRLYVVVPNNMEAGKEYFGEQPPNSKTMQIIDEDSDVFRSTLPDSLPPERSVDHESYQIQMQKYQTEGYLSYHQMNCAQPGSISRRIYKVEEYV